MNKKTREIILQVNMNNQYMNLLKVTIEEKHHLSSMEDSIYFKVRLILEQITVMQYSEKLRNNEKTKFKELLEGINKISIKDIITPLDLHALDRLLIDLKTSFNLKDAKSSDITAIKRNSEITYRENEHVSTDISFKSVVGMQDVKDKLYDVIDQFKNAEKYKAWNIKPIGGVLLYGPSGTGKSYISEALANEIDAKFIKVSAGDIMSKYIGESGRNIKKIFDDARKEKCSIVYIDEIDFVASKRSGDENKERNATLNELLVQMAAPNNDNIFMIFATNMMELLDPAFLRSGRCDFKIEVALPDYEARKGILELCAKNRPISDDVDFDKLAKNLSGLNCADVTHISNEAARRALKAKQESITQLDYDTVYEEMICGASNGSKVVDDEEKRIVAVHESGHLIANEFYKVNKTKKISILPRGSALGFVLHSNDDKKDKYLYSENEMLNRVKMLLAGRVAEDIMFGGATTGASNDLKKATSIVTDMICKYGFDEELGLVVINPNDPMMKVKLNNKIKTLLDNLYEETKLMLRHHNKLLIKLSETIIEKEEMNDKEIQEFLQNNSDLIFWKTEEEKRFYVPEEINA